MKPLAPRSILVLFGALLLVAAAPLHARASADGSESSATSLLQRPPLVPSSPHPADPVVGAAAATAEASPYWQPLTTVGRTHHAAVYDPVRGRVIALMGQMTAIGYGTDYLYDAQALSLGAAPSWSPLASVGGPYSSYEGRTFTAAAYDPDSDRVLVHGGFVDGVADPGRYVRSALADLWELRLSARPEWREIVVAGPNPGRRFQHAAAYDPARHRLLVFGGFTHLPESPTYLDRPLADLWELDLSGVPAWHELAESGDVPTPGLEGTALLDAARERLLFVAKDSVWATPLANTGQWQRFDVLGAGPAEGGPAVLDRARDRLLVQSGIETWALPLSVTPTWSKVCTMGPDILGEGPGPVVPLAFTITWDPVGDRLVLHGGVGGDEPGAGRTWFLSFAGTPRWTALAPQPAMYGHEVVYDEARDRMLAVPANSTDVLSFPLAHPTGWQVLPVAGDTVTFTGHRAIYDARRDRVLVFTGNTGRTWQLALDGAPRWSLLPASGPSRIGASLMLDPLRDRALLFGGSGQSDTWQLRLDDASADWEPIAIAGTLPPGTRYHRAVYDAARDRMVVGMGELGSIWALSLGGTPQWTRLVSVPAVTYPWLGSLLYDPVRDRLVALFGGLRDAAMLTLPLGEASPSWAFGDYHSGNWNDFTPPLRSEPAALYDPVRDQFVLSGGRIGSTSADLDVRRDVWAYTWGTPVIAVAVDIRPGDPDNTVSARSNGALPVAILSSASFDATTVDPLSVRLAGAGVRVNPHGKPLAWNRDANGDGRADLVLQVDAGALQLSPGDTVAVLTGTTRGGIAIRGQDRIRVVGVGGGSGDDGGSGSGAPSAGPAVTITGVHALPGGRLCVALALPPGQGARLDLFDVSGRRVTGASVTGTGGAQQLVLGDGALPAGVYWVRLACAKEALTRRVVVLR
jgi:hypothetical protein